jgi:[acyl-carrier-protein] S-malonyltransferase
VVNVLLFPGQGTQKVGMARDLATRFPAARDLLRSVDEALGFSLTTLMWEGPELDLQQTVNTQPAILAHSAAVLAAVGPGLDPVAGAAGHSLGEYSAYLAAGTMSAVDAARLVRRRGQLMQDAGASRPGAMAAVLGLDGDKVVAACRDASNPESVAVAANLNAPDQTVISGDPDAVARASEGCKAAGAKRVMPLKVSGAFHSPLMAAAQAGLVAALAAVPFQDPRFPVVANVSAAPVRTATAARQLLEAQLTAPVQWVRSVQTLDALAPAVRFIEVGPGAVLGGLVKRIVPDASVVSLGTADEVEKFLA